MSMGQSINFILGFICQTTLKIMNLSAIVVDVIVGEDFTSSLHNNCDWLVCLFVVQKLEKINLDAQSAVFSYE